MGHARRKVSLLFLASLFLFSIFTVEPDYVQGYQNCGFPVFVENDAAFVVCDGYALVRIVPHAWVDFLFLSKPEVPDSSTPATHNFYRGPPLISPSL